MIMTIDEQIQLAKIKVMATVNAKTLQMNSVATRRLIKLRMRSDVSLLYNNTPITYSARIFLVAYFNTRFRLYGNHSHYDMIINQAFTPSAINKFGDVRHAGIAEQDSLFHKKGQTFETWLLKGTDSFIRLFVFLMFLSATLTAALQGRC